MASSSPSGSSGDDSDQSSVPPNSLAGLSLSIFADLLANLTHDIALQSHRSEKLLRAKQQHLQPPSTTSTDSSPPPANANPLSVIPTEIICQRCHLPQHMTLDSASGAQKKKFCLRLPFQNAPLHDIYGNPFPTIKDNGNKNNKGDNKSADSPAEDGAAVVGKKNGAVYFKCTSCDNEKVLFSRFAAHLEKCLGLAGRKSSRAAMAKMNNNSGSGSGSPMLSAADAQGGKSASRKASPEKKSKSPVPVEETAPVPATTTKPVYASSAAGIAAAATSTNATGTPKKKKKKVAAAAAAAAAAKAASVPPEDDRPHLVPPDTPTKHIDVPSLSLLPPPITAKDSTATPATLKKRKRKADLAAAAAAAAAAATDTAGSATTGGDDKDGSITLSAKPPPQKKQKLTVGGDKPTGLESIKKSQLSKFKNRANSPSPGGGSIKKGETIRTSSPNPLASPPTTHKPLPPKPPTPLTGPLSASPMAASSSSQGVSTTPKPRKPKPGAIGGGSVKKSGASGDGGSVKKSAKPKIKKVGSIPGKTVPVPRVAGKSVPGVARKGPKE